MILAMRKRTANIGKAIYYTMPQIKKGAEAPLFQCKTYLLIIILRVCSMPLKLTL